MCWQGSCTSFRQPKRQPSQKKNKKHLGWIATTGQRESNTISPDSSKANLHLTQWRQSSHSIKAIQSLGRGLVSPGTRGGGVGWVWHTLQRPKGRGVIKHLHQARLQPKPNRVEWHLHPSALKLCKFLWFYWTRICPSTIISYNQYLQTAAIVILKVLAKEPVSAMTFPKQWKRSLRHILKALNRNHNVELTDTKALWADEGSSQNRPVWCSVLPHPHSHQQMCPSQSCILSHADMPCSARLAAHTGVFPDACMSEGESAGWTHI